MRARDIFSVVATALAAALAMIVVSSAVGQGADPDADSFADGDQAEIERRLKEARDKREGLVAMIEDYEQRVI